MPRDPVPSKQADHFVLGEHAQAALASLWIPYEAVVQELVLGFNFCASAIPSCV